MANIASGYILTAVRDVLDAAAGSLRTISSTRFDGDAYESLSDEEKSRRATDRPVFDVRITSLRRNSASPPTNGSLAIYTIGVEVLVFRHIGNAEKLVPATRDTAAGLAIEDADVIAQALEYPGNLTTDSGSHATGLVGGLLQHESSELRRVDLADDRPGLIETAHVFRGYVTVTQTT